MRRRVLCTLLALVLLLALLPVTAGAENNWDGWTIFNGSNLNLSGGNYYLNTNVTAGSTIYIDGTVTLDLNGQILTSSQTDDVLFSINEGGTLTIKDSGTGGTIDGNNRNSGIDVSGGMLIMESGTIANCMEKGDEGGGDGGAVDVSSSGRFIMKGGLIVDCKADDDGGAVDIGKNCVFIMNGGTIRDCSADDDGGAVFIKGGGTFTMSGSAKIENCTAGNNGDALYNKDGGHFSMSANATINGKVFGAYTVTFDSNGGSTVPQQMCANAPAAKPADPTRPGYTFEGWYNGGTKYDFTQPVTENLTLTAHWTPVTVTPVEEPTTPWWAILPVLDQTVDFPFYDVDANDWFYEAVRSAWENELIDGVTARYFKPDSTLTVAQAIKLAAALHQKQSVGFVTLQNGGTHWYDNYVNYAVTNGLIESVYQSKSAEDMNKAITRAEFVHILSKLLSTGAINTVNTIPDVKSGDAYADEIFAFYRAGILTGSDRLGTFHPESSLKRSEAAAILVRLYDATQRQYITLR